MKLTQSFFESLDEWVDYFDIDENHSFDCLYSECTGDCSIFCIPDQDSDFLEGPYVNSERYFWPLELQRIGGLQ